LKHQQKAGDQRELAATLNNLGSLAADQRDLRSAERYYRLSLQAKQVNIQPPGLVLQCVIAGYVLAAGVLLPWPRAWFPG
jgi:hypothetical protein